MEKTYRVLVFNTMTGEFEEIELPKEIYDEFRRGEWRIQKNEKKKSKNETPFSSLIGGEETAYENFDEFIDERQTADQQIYERERKEMGQRALEMLTPTMKKRFLMRYECQLTIKEIAKSEGVSIDSIRESLHTAQARLKNFLENFIKTPPKFQFSFLRYRTQPQAESRIKYCRLSKNGNKDRLEYLRSRLFGCDSLSCQKRRANR